MPPLVLFLDFDGVLNGEAFLRRQRNHPLPGGLRNFDPDNLAALDHLCRQLAIERIVVSSTWRIDRSVAELRSMLAREGFPHAERIVDVTPDFGGGLRARPAEIHAWAANHRPLRMLVLDDAPLELREDFVRVDPNTGLTLALVEGILATLAMRP